MRPLMVLLLTLALVACNTTDSGDPPTSTAGDVAGDAGGDAGGDGSGDGGDDSLFADGGDTSADGGDAPGSGSGDDGGDDSSLIDLSPEEQAVDDVAQFVSAYASAIHTSRVHARKQQKAMRIVIDRAAHKVTVRLGDAVVASFAYPESLKVIKEPKVVQVATTGVISTSARPYRHPLPTPDTAHVLARVPGFAPHAFIRFIPGQKQAMISQANFAPLGD